MSFTRSLLPRYIAAFHIEFSHRGADMRSHDKRTIYLDFDGVLHPSICPPDEFFSCLPVLAPLQSFDFDIVISSSWRFHYTQAELASWLGALGTKVIGQTGPAREGAHARWREICGHAEHHGISRWIAVDDSAFEFPRSEASAGRLILCNAKTGITEPETGLIMAFLRR